MPVGHPESLPDTEVVDGQNIRTPQLEDEQHLDGPPPDPAAGAQSVDDLVVGERADLP